MEALAFWTPIWVMLLAAPIIAMLIGGVVFMIEWLIDG